MAGQQVAMPAARAVLAEVLAREVEVVTGERGWMAGISGVGVGVVMGEGWSGGAGISGVG